MPRRGGVKHQAMLESPGAAGAWTTELTRRVGLIPLAAGSAMRFAVEESEIMWTVMLPYTAGIKSNWRLRLSPSGRILKIKAWTLFRNRNKWLKLTCVERLRDGVAT